MCHYTSVIMDSKKKATRVRPTFPYIKKRPQRKIKPCSTSEMDVLDIGVDTEYDLLKSDSETSDRSVAVQNPAELKQSSLEMANADMMSLLKEIREYQSTQCTKNDLQTYSLTIKKQFDLVDKRVSNNTSAISSVEARLCSIESQLLRNDYEAELNKQNALSRNVSIMGIEATVNEDLTTIALKIFAIIGCEFTRNDLFGCYRVKTSGTFTNIFVTKFNDFAAKQRILKAKVNKVVRLQDVLGNSSSNGNQIVFINNHVTPYFENYLLKAAEQ